MRPKNWDSLARNYFEEIESPFAEGVENPLFSYLKDIRQSDGYTAVDLGCGIGNLLNHISESFSQITCIDFSEEMLRVAKECHGGLKHVSFIRSDLKDLRKFRGEFDFAFAINSVIEPSLNSVRKILSEIHGVLVPGGTLLAVFPALESDILRAAITYDREERRVGSENEAINNVRSIMCSDDYDLLFGFYDNGGRQKHFFKSELEYRLRRAGFRDISFDKVLYPWSDCVDSSLKRQPDDFRLFDWFVKAKR